MEAIHAYLDGIEDQVSRDGFMTNVMRRHLDRLGRLAPDPATSFRIRGLVARYYRPYTAPTLSLVKA